MKKLSILLFFFACVLSISAQTRSTQLTIQVNSVAGDNLNGQAVKLIQTDYAVSYGTLKLNAQGQCVLKVYPGNHQLTVDREGFEAVDCSFTVDAAETEKTVSVTLSEKTRTPFALQTAVQHNVFTGANSIAVSWNREAPAFFDDFEGYDPFSISFGQWTGIDADLEAAAPLIGAYPNRGVMQYAQIINPLTVSPTWWYDYPILRPYSGQQYVGFTRTSSGNANDDWLISPTVTPGTDNVLTFMGKAADQFTERFMVYVTEKVDNPTQADFERIDQGNYEAADYTGWRLYSYDLSKYAGKTIKFAIRYVSNYNLYRSFMLMIDDVYVGQPVRSSRPMAQAARLSSRRSPDNPNEKFDICLDGNIVGTTDGYDYVIQDVAGGDHTVGVRASYIQSQSDMTTVNVSVPDNGFARVTFHVTANSQLSAEGQVVVVTSMNNAESYELTVTEGNVVLPSLPHGQYLVNVAEGAFEEYQQTIDVTADADIDVVLKDKIRTPYNITADADEGGHYVLRWNQELIFTDSFEAYDDFATGSFGDWITVDSDQLPVYPVALGSLTNVVSFPGSGTANNPMPIAPMVFNPWKTTPAMMPTDKAIAAPTGDKTVIFFSAQQAKSSKWLISPLLTIRDGFQLAVTAKAYTSAYPESMEFCVSTEGSTRPDDFMQLSTVSSIAAGQWTIYATDLSQLAGQTVRLAVHYTSTDAFLMQIDDFTVGPESGQGELVDYGNVVRYDIYVDGDKVGESTTSTFVLPMLAAGNHTIGIKAIYKDGESDMASYVINVDGVGRVELLPQTILPTAYFTLSGQQVSVPAKGGVYLLRQNGVTKKVKR